MKDEEIEAKARELATQDNVCTADAIYLVQRKVREWGWDPDYTESIGWVSGEREEEVASDTDTERFIRFEDGKFDEEEDGDAEQWTRTGFRDRWEFVQPFLTLEAAEAFRVRQRHNIGESRIYVDSGYRNPEWQWIRAHVTGCAAALRAVRNEAYANGYSTAIETAAQVADSEEIPDPSKAPKHCSAEQVAIVIGVVQVTREHIASRIRSLSSKPAGGHDGG